MKRERKKEKKKERKKKSKNEKKNNYIKNEFSIKNIGLWSLIPFVKKKLNLWFTPCLISLPNNCLFYLVPIVVANLH